MSTTDKLHFFIVEKTVIMTLMECWKCIETKKCNFEAGEMKKKTES